MLLLVEGATNRQIADELGVSVATVGAHVRHMLDKWDCRNRTHLIVTFLLGGTSAHDHRRGP